MDTLPTIWFIAISILWIGYLFLEGFDLGVGMHMLLTARNDTDRRVMLNTIGPVWDGNEVWLVTAGAATFAAFPFWYASLFSALYIPLTVVLLGLIFRAVAIEYRGKGHSDRWKHNWDLALGVGSFIVAFGIGALLALTTTGLPLDANGDRVGGPFSWFTGYAVLGGFAVVGFCLVHAATFLALKSDGAVRVAARRWFTRWSPIALLPLAGWVIAVQLRQGNPATWSLVVIAVVAAVLGLDRRQSRARGQGVHRYGSVPRRGRGIDLRRGLPRRAAVDDRPRLRPDRAERIERGLHARRDDVGGRLRDAAHHRVSGVDLLGVPASGERPPHPADAPRARGRPSVKRGAALGRHSPRILYPLGVLSALKAVALVALAEALARGIVAVIDRTDPIGWVTLGVAAALLRAGAAWATTSFAARSAIGLKESTRSELADRAMRGGSGSVGDLTVLATRGLDELDTYFTTVLPAMTSTAVIPLVVGLRILSLDWISALVVVLTVPLIPVFMALIGMQTRETVQAASVALTRLSDHLVELARGLPTLVGLGRVEEQTAALRDISEGYRRRTMRTLRTAFLSSLALELISTISVAVVAVFIGFRLVDGSLPLAVGLLVLILAPECYAPFRDLGSAFHASQDGLAALDRARSVINTPAPGSILRAATDSRPNGHGAPTIRLESVSVRYAGRQEYAVAETSFELPAGEITALCGPSGSGKSSLLAVLAGRLGTGTDGALGTVTVTGSVTGIDPVSVAWVPQHPHTVGETVLEELGVYARGVTVVTEEQQRSVLRLVDLEWALGADPGQLSPGELRRLAVARALVRVEAGATVVLLDEPTAHLDDTNSHLIEGAIDRLRGRVTVVLASHDPRLLRLATRRVALAPAAASVSTRAESDSPSRAAQPESDDRPSDAMNLGTGGHSVARADVARLLGVLARPVAGRLALAVVLGVLASLFAISLTAVSGWLIVRASQQPEIMYLLVAIVGVRFFGIGRSVLRYAERLVTHDAIFVSVGHLRVRLWRGLASRGANSRKLLTGGTALDYLVTTADEVRDLAPRVLLPPVVGAVSGAAAVVAAGLLVLPGCPPPGIERCPLSPCRTGRGGVGRPQCRPIQAADSVHRHPALRGHARRCGRASSERRRRCGACLACRPRCAVGTRRTPKRRRARYRQRVRHRRVRGDGGPHGGRQRSRGRGRAAPGRDRRGAHPPAARPHRPAARRCRRRAARSGPASGPPTDCTVHRRVADAVRRARDHHTGERDRTAASRSRVARRLGAGLRLRERDGLGGGVVGRHRTIRFRQIHPPLGALRIPRTRVGPIPARRRRLE